MQKSLMNIVFATAVVALGIFVISGKAQTSPAPQCDRACMTGLVDQYLAALVKHDPSGLPLSKGVRFTENTAEIPIGYGLWVGATEPPTTFKVYAVDPATRQVAFYGVMKEMDRPLIIALRLKVVNGKITEVEHVLARNIRPDRMQNLIQPRPALLEDVPASDRTPREVMINAADSYFEAIEQGNGAVAPFADDCVRHENGGQTTHNKTPVPWPVDLGSPEANRAMALLGTFTCKAQIDSQVMSFITRLWPRRLAVIDEQKGLVFSFPMFQHRGGDRSVKIKGVPGVDSIAMGGGTSNLQAGEIFKIRNGQIHEIEAMGVSLPYGTRSGWEQ
jgi:hypothetical protein